MSQEKAGGQPGEEDGQEGRWPATGERGAPQFCQAGFWSSVQVETCRVRLVPSAATAQGQVQAEGAGVLLAWSACHTGYLLVPWSPSVGQASGNF